MITEIVVEILNEADKERVQKLLVDSYLQYENGFDDPKFWEGYLEDIITSVDSPDVDKILVARDEQEILGTVQLFETAEKAYAGHPLDIHAPFIRLLGVHPNARGRGVARKLLDACLDYAREKEAKSIYLFTGDSMVKAIRLYEYYGFVRDFEEESKLGDMAGARCYRFDL
ncbi:GNAT family N-acetyltransferase [Psychrobacillus sp. FJAT-51614]|uniref:GNAT family N-acetyltransferase n=1 Tax=Psychrobacillus mangrovi TaxID=3117745 RepID=A0ABU8F4T5_9BACI